ncbi:MAG: ferritin-like domain-containing protein, partial [Pseudomonadota bacterium]
IFRVLVKTLLNAGIITDRTRAFYAIYVDLDELKSEGDRMVGDDIAEDGIRYLQEINFKDRIAQSVKIAAE